MQTITSSPTPASTASTATRCADLVRPARTTGSGSTTSSLRPSSAACCGWPRPRRRRARGSCAPSCVAVDDRDDDVLVRAPSRRRSGRARACRGRRARDRPARVESVDRDRHVRRRASLDDEQLRPSSPAACRAPQTDPTTRPSLTRLGGLLLAALLGGLGPGRAGAPA